MYYTRITADAPSHKQIRVCSQARHRPAARGNTRLWPAAYRRKYRRIWAYYTRIYGQVTIESCEQSFCISFWVWTRIPKPQKRIRLFTQVDCDLLHIGANIGVFGPIFAHIWERSHSSCVNKRVRFLVRAYAYTNTKQKSYTTVHTTRLWPAAFRRKYRRI